MMKVVRALIAVVALAVAVPAASNVVHVLSFRYKSGVSAAQRVEIARAIRSLAATSVRHGKPYIVSIRGGAPISREGYDQQFQQMFIIEFKNTADRDYFVGPPYASRMEANHQKAADLVMPNVERDATGKITGSFVYDFEDE